MDKPKQIGKLRKIIQNAIKKKVDIDPKDRLSDIVLSSLTFVVILGEIERIFDIEIPEEELEQENFTDLETIGIMIDRINEEEC